MSRPGARGAREKAGTTEAPPCDGRGGAALRLEDLLGRRVLAGNHRSVGRIEEFRAERRGDRCIVTGVVLGPGGLLERLGVGVRLLFGSRARGRVARWEQIDWSDQRRLRLTCAASELRDA